MKRIAFTFKIKPDLKNKYKEDHDKIWPELVNIVKNYGINNNSIFFKKDGTLFHYLEIDDSIDFNDVMSKLSLLDVNIRWQKKMQKYIIKADRSNLGAKLEILEEVFHLD